MDFSLSRQRLYHLVRQETFSLAEAALYIAQEEYPDLDPQIYLGQLDQIAQQVRQHLPEERYPLKWIRCINHTLFQQMGFIGNNQDYYDPRNSFLNDVLEQRTGIPITLSLVYLEVCQRIGLPMVGINFPGHFLIRPQQADLAFYVDPFHGGEILFEQDCRDRLAQLYQRPVDLLPEFFAPISPAQFLIRMLTNLKQIYLNLGDLQKCLATSERILLIRPEDLAELRDRGLLYYQLGRWNEARHDLEQYLVQSPTAPDRAKLLRLLKQLSQSS
jgi:regulator of sirC expression with transglutaminase-like and TPR domain